MTEKAPVNLFIDYFSQPSRAILTLCNLENIPYRVVETRLAKGDTLSQKFKQINPRGQVPAIIHNDRPIIESGAILRYLCNEFLPEDNQFYPRSNQEKLAEIDQYLNDHYHTTRLVAGYIFATLFAKPLGVKMPESDEYFKKRALLA